jgi:DNA-binding PadR family transcriptional regulator
MVEAPTRRPRITLATRAILAELAADPEAHRYGLDLGTTTGLPSGTVHPILARLEGLGWVESGWEEVEPRDVGRPRRRYYRLTPEGARSAERALATRPRPTRARTAKGLT